MSSSMSMIWKSNVSSWTIRWRLNFVTSLNRFKQTTESDPFLTNLARAA